MEAEIGRRVGVDLDRVEVAAAARDVRTPTLVVHDVDDADVPLDEGRAVARALPAGELHITRGLGHRRILKDPTVIARAVEFLTA
jgi:pimeloyl-ACP methyl ester carboxylesterase